MPYLIRQLSVDDINAYRAIRLEALQAFPHAYGTTHAEALAHPISTFRKTLKTNTLFGAYVDDKLCGIAYFVAATGVQTRHIGHIYQMYVAKSQQGRGLGIKLLEEVFNFAKDQVQQIYLGVGTKNFAALALYKKAGFEIYGTEPRALCVEGHYIDEHLMVKFLNKKETQ